MVLATALSWYSDVKESMVPTKRTLIKRKQSATQNRVHLALAGGFLIVSDERGMSSVGGLLTVRVVAS